MTERDRFEIYLYSYLHIPYRWGGASPLVGLDCSGLAQIALGWLGLDPPGDQTADGLYRHFRAHGQTVPIADLGDLCFYGQETRVAHVAIALDAQRMIEAGGGTARTVTRAIAEQQDARVKVSRIKRRPDLVAIIRPNGLPW
jgi:cell wall-associated NlpC family hydrolase